MKRINISVLLFSLVFLTQSCSTPESSVTVMSEGSDSSDMQIEAERANDEPPPPPVDLPESNGTAEIARKQIVAIFAAFQSKRLYEYSYIYDNGSGEDPLNGSVYLSRDDEFNGKGHEWYLNLYTKYYEMDYFYSKSQKLFAIRQFKKEDGIHPTAEIFYNEDGSLMKGSWLKRENEDTTNLVNYKGDYWYDFLEGWPYYPTTEKLRSDKNLKYQQ